MANIDRHYRCYGCGFDLETTNYEVIKRACPECGGFLVEPAIPEALYKVQPTPIVRLYEEFSV